jgi:ribosomal-protein-alanine N-acetyltransferase
VSALLQSVLPEPLHRPMTVGDVAAVLALEQTAYAFPWTRGNFIDSLAAGYWTLLRIAVDNELLGYAVATAVVDELHLLNLTVAPGHEGRGHASALLDRLQSHGRASGMRSLWLEVRTGNQRAQRLYEWRGFRKVGLRPRYYPAPGGRREDAVVMSLTLQAGDGVD